MTSTKPPEFRPGAEFPGNEEVFEINDFTVVTELEKVVVAVEAILHEWGLSGTETRPGTPRLTNVTRWDQKSERIQFGEGNHLKITHFWPDIEEAVEALPSSSTDPETSHLSYPSIGLISPDSDFYPRNNIVAMYAATEYIVFSPWHSDDDRIVTEDQKNMIISAIRIAALSCDCELPMFLQYGPNERQLYHGVLITRATTTMYEGVHLYSEQPRHSHLSGLLQLFKEKVQCPIPLIDAKDIRVSVQIEFTHKLSRHNEMTDDDSSINVMQVPFGSASNPIKSLVLLALWPNLKEDILNENESLSDLDPMSAFAWSARVDFDHVDRFLDGALHRLLDLPGSMYHYETAALLLGIDSRNVAPGARALDGLTGSTRSIKIGSQSLTNPGGLNLDEPPLPLPKEIMNFWINEIFDVRSRSSTPTEELRTLEINDKKRDEKTKEPSLETLKTRLKTVKAAPKNSITARLANAFTHSLVDSIYGSTTFAQLWYEFVQRLRYHYENTKDIPGMSSIEYPDLSTCILHQKIEMLQCCIIAKRKRHQLYENCNNFANDEFFDAEEDIPDDEPKQPFQSTSEPIGRYRLLDGEGTTLKDYPDRPIYIPITQDREPMTEDMIEEHAHYLSSLEEGQERTEAQMDTLKSDMQAFKAANPGALFEDFLRWHSPKDITWNEEDSKWELSDRMLIEGNSWLNCWETSNSLPVIHQKRLFNESKRAQEILSWLENSRCGQVSELVRPIIFAQAVRYLLAEIDPVISLIEPEKMCTTTIRACRSGNRDDFLEASREIRKVETALLHYRAIFNVLDMPTRSNGPSRDPNALKDLALKLIEEEKLIRDPENTLISHGVPIIGGPNEFVGDSMRRLVLENKKKPEITKRQYTLRWLVPRPNPESRLCPQRLFASLSKKEFRLCGAFTDDAIFR